MAGVRTDEGLTGLKVRPGGLQIAGDLGERRFRVAELEVDLIARKEQRCTDRHVVAKEGLDGEGIEAALQLAATIETDIVLGRPSGFIIANERALAVAGNV